MSINLAIKYPVGCKIRVVAAYDDTLPARFIGLIGRVVSVPVYQELGDDPIEDPLLEVEHKIGRSKKFEKQFYWTDEVEIVS